jgi:hypothetical protein
MCRMVRLARATVIATMVFGVAACEKPSSLIIEIADYTFDNEDEVRVIFEEHFDNNRRIRDFVRTDFAPIPHRASSKVGPYYTEDEGTAVVRVELLRRREFSRLNEPIRIALGDASFEPRSDQRLRLTVFRSAIDPRPLCQDICEEAISFPIAPEYQRVPGEALWLAWKTKDWFD